jgi:uncharacterized cupin superfamily protein
MAIGSKVFKPADVSESNASGYPEPFREGQRKRYNRRLGDHAGLTNYGVNLIRVLPGGQSSARHAHSKQDEFVYVLEGEFVLVTDAGRETVGPGNVSAFQPERATAIIS